MQRLDRVRQLVDDQDECSNRAGSRQKPAPETAPPTRGWFVHTTLLVLKRNRGQR